MRAFRKFRDAHGLRQILPCCLLLFACSYLLLANISRSDRFRLNRWFASSPYQFGPAQGEAIDPKGLHFPQNQFLTHRFSNPSTSNRQSFSFELNIDKIELVHFRIIGKPTPIDFSLTPDLLGENQAGRHIIKITQAQDTVALTVDDKIIKEINAPGFQSTGFEIEDMNSTFHLAEIRYDPPVDGLSGDISFIQKISARWRICLAAFASIIFSFIFSTLPQRGSSPAENAFFMVPLVGATLFPMNTPLGTTLWTAGFAGLAMFLVHVVNPPPKTKTYLNIAIPTLAAFFVALIGRFDYLGLSCSLLLAALTLILLQLLALKKTMRGFIFVFLGVFALTLACLEATLHFSAMAPAAKPMNVGAAFEEHDGLFFAPGDLFDDKVPLSVAKLRFRNRSAKLKADPGVFRIITMGGSTTYGDGIEHNRHTWSGKLEKMFSEQLPDQRFEVLNGGVKGYNLFQVMLLFLRYAADYNPDLLVLYLNTADSADTKGPYTYRELWRMKNEGQWSTIDELIKDEPLPEPSGWVAGAQRVLHKVQLYNLLTKSVIKTREKSLKPLADRVGAIKEVNPANDYRANLLEIIETCKTRGIRLVLVDEYEVDPNTNPESKGTRVRNIMKAEAQNHGISFLGLNGDFQQREDSDKLVFPHDPAHLSHQGHIEVAKRIARHLLDEGLLQ
jgi:lysophospholipase L1-like esterase